MSWDYGIVSTAQVDPDTGMITVTIVNPLTDDTDAETLGQVDLLQPIGFFSIPYPPTDNGRAQVLFGRDIGNTNVALGGTDERAATAYGNAVPGDSGIYSTGPKQASKVLCKEDSRTVAAITEDTQGKNIVFTLNGEKDRAQLSAFGHMVQVTREGGIEMIDNTGASVTFKDGAWTFNCVVNLPNAIAPLKTGPGGGAPNVPIPGVNCSIP